ncbi:hypothetical protein HDU82_001228 [Entophlyctis luteolus]|nr:hypothetical protein HDU82_001228 [Entophlyctis luteolus]
MSAFASASRPGPVAADPDPHALVHAIYARLLFVEARLAELSRFIQPLLVSSDEHHHQLHQQPLQLPPVHLLHQARQEQAHLEHPEPQQHVDPKQPEPLPPAQPQSQVVQLSDSAVVRPPMLPIEVPTTLPAESDPIILVARNPQANTSSPSLGRVGPTWFSFDAGDDDLRYRDRDALFSESDESDCSLRRNIDSSPMLDVGGGTDWIHGANHNDNSPMILAHTDNECEREEHGTNRPKGKSLPCKGKRRFYCHQFNRKDNCARTGRYKHLHLCLRCDQPHAAVTCFKTPKERTQFLQKCIDWSVIYLCSRHPAYLERTLTQEHCWL